MLYQPRNLLLPSDFELRRRPFEPDDKVEVLVRLSPDHAARWLPGTVTFVELETLVDVEVGEGDVRKGMFDYNYHVRDIQYPVTRTRASFLNIPFTLPSGGEDWTSKKFRVAWEERTGTLLMSVDLEQRLMVVLAESQLPIAPVEMFRKVLDILSQEKKKAPTTKKPESTMINMHPGEAPAALLIPEMLMGILRHLDLKDRLTLHGVSESGRTLSKVIRSFV